ncbi:MAG: 50S ribosomal protein L4 [Candidatus Pacebacteria bacterium]|nr:50S ribosomal protein L4 [Candidatus Paceibacterota bacterium]
MSKVKIYNLKGKETGEAQLPKSLDVKFNPELIQQVVQTIAANLRPTVAHTKTREEVRGGGKKPWKQKGTGRARHGSIRSPLWKGGGVSFGPRSERDYSKKVNHKMSKLALASALAQKAVDGEFKIIDSLDLENNKTKILAETVRKISGTRSILLVIPKEAKNVFMAAKNLARVTTVFGRELNAYEIMKNKEVLMDKKVFESYE